MDTIKLKMKGPIKPEELYNARIFRNPFSKEVQIKCASKEVYEMGEEFLHVFLDDHSPHYHFQAKPPVVNYITMFHYHKLIFNPPATIIYWNDGSKTVVKCREDEEFDPQTGFAMAYLKKVYGDQYGHQMRDIRKEYERQMKVKKKRERQKEKKEKLEKLVQAFAEAGVEDDGSWDRALKESLDKDKVKQSRLSRLYQNMFDGDLK